MRTFDLSLYRSTVGFDRLFDLFDQAAGHDARRVSALQHRADRRERLSITVAVAGFGEADFRSRRKRTR